MAFFGFGKRASPSNAQARPISGIPLPPPGATKIIPDELWEGEMGNLLRAAGLSPDDESNFLPTPERVAARIASDQAAFQAKLMKMNDEIFARTNGGYVQPSFLFPEPCWNGDTGNFLTMRLRMSPYEDWNVAFLPPDEQYCAVLGLPRHPMQDALLFQKDVDEFLRVKMAQMDEVRQECDRTRDFAVFKKKQDDLKELIRHFAGWLREQYTNVWNHHVANRAHA
jgi:hypothetical protein